MKSIKSKMGFIYRGIIGFLQNKFEKVPKISDDAERIKIGESVKKRLIYAYRIGDGKIKFCFGGGTHGDEVGTVKFIHHLINYIYNHRENYKDFSFYFIPVINPDGYEIGKNNPDYFNGGRIGRFNANNVDLNKNFPTKSFKKYSFWSRGDNYTESVKIFAGEYGGSEPETKAVTNFLKDNNIKYFFNYHSAGGDVQPNLIEPSDELNRIYANEINFGFLTEEKWQSLDQTGTPKEWCEENSIVFSEIENSVRWGSDWKRQKSGVEKVLEYLKRFDD